MDPLGFRAGVNGLTRWLNLGLANGVGLVGCQFGGGRSGLALAKPAVSTIWIALAGATEEKIERLEAASVMMDAWERGDLDRIDLIWAGAGLRHRRQFRKNAELVARLIVEFRARMGQTVTLTGCPLSILFLERER